MKTEKWIIEIPSDVRLSDVIIAGGDTFREKMMLAIIKNAKEVIELHAEGEDHSSPDYSIDGKDVSCLCMDVFVPKDEVK